MHFIWRLGFWVGKEGGRQRWLCSGGGGIPREQRRMILVGKTNKMEWGWWGGLRKLEGNVRQTRPLVAMWKGKVSDLEDRVEGKAEENRNGGGQTPCR